LSQEAGRNLFAIEAVSLRPVIGIVVSAKKPVDPGEMDGKVFVDTLFLGGVVPMTISGHNQKFFDPFSIGTEIAMRPGGVKSDENQIGQDDRLGKTEHERSEDKSANQGNVHEMGARAGDPIQRLGRMMNGMKTP